MKRVTLSALLCITSYCAFAQGTLSGDLMMNVNFYQKDSTIGANSELYEKRLSGGEAWLSLRYSNKGFTATARVDAFHNSNLYSPLFSKTSFGLGAWSLSKEWENLTVTGGYIYDQIGSGVLFRAYEDRGLLIDNALIGLMVKYRFNDHINAKVFTGQQKDIGNFDKSALARYEPVIKGVNIEGDFNAGKDVHLSPGVGAINRTLDDKTMNAVAASINSQELSTRFEPKYNMYAFTAYNTLTVGNFSWYVEGAYKTQEAVSRDGATFFNKSGNVVYSTLGYARKGIAVNLTGKRTENFSMRANPFPDLNLPIRGQINWQPIVARLRPQRLMARYTPASQDFSELALGGDVLISPNDNFDLTLNYTHINTLEDIELYREAYGEIEYRGLSKWILQGGVQYIRYNQELYQLKPLVPVVEAITPFVEATYRINNKQSIRGEVEYMHTKQDYGSWLFALLEFNIAPSWSFAVSDMYTLDLNPENPSNLKDPVHYYNAFVAYTKGPHRITASYVKQPDGINCTGGVCRYEPAFSGVRFGLTTSF